MIRNATSNFVRTVTGRRATARASRFSVPASATPLLRAGSASATSGCAIDCLGYGLRLGFETTESTISHFPLIFCTS